MLFNMKKKKKNHYITLTKKKMKEDGNINNTYLII